jgi:hypothetical protein
MNGLKKIPIIGSLLSGPPKPPKPPLMPDPLDPNVLNAQRQKLAQGAAKGGGRQATILQSGGDYQSTAMGG